MKRFRQIFITVGIVLLFFSSVVYGFTWTANKKLTNTVGGSHSPAIAVDGANIYVVWQDYTPSNGEIYFKRSVDGGITWKSDKRLTNTSGNSSNPAIAVDGTTIYVVWSDDTPGNYEIYFRRLNDGGITWTASQRLTSTAGGSHSPAIAVDGTNIYVVWQDDTPGNSEVYLKRSVDGGVTWTADQRLTNNAGISQHPIIAVDGSNIYVAWADNRPGNSEVYLKRSVDGGVTWTADQRLTNNAGISQNPAIAVDGSNIYVVWHDQTPGNPEIYFKRSVDGGIAWTADQRLTEENGASCFPVIAVDGSNIYVVWANDPGLGPEIYFKRSVDGGVTWKVNRKLTKTRHYFPAIAVDGSNIYVVWEYDFDEIYFKKGVLD
jgi:Tol biopolymer transport system component